MECTRPEQARREHEASMAGLKRQQVASRKELARLRAAAERVALEAAHTEALRTVAERYEEVVLGLVEAAERQGTQPPPPIRQPKPEPEPDPEPEPEPEVSLDAVAAQVEAVISGLLNQKEREEEDLAEDLLKEREDLARTIETLVAGLIKAGGGGGGGGGGGPQAVDEAADDDDDDEEDPPAPPSSRRRQQRQELAEQQLQAAEAEAQRLLAALASEQAAHDTTRRELVKLATLTPRPRGALSLTSSAVSVTFSAS